MPDERVPIEEVLRGITIAGLRKGWTPLDALIMIKCFYEDDTKWFIRQSSKLCNEEVLGVFITQLDLLRYVLYYETNGDEDDENGDDSLPEEEIPIGDALRGLTIDGLPAGSLPIEALLLLKCFNEDGNPAWMIRPSSEMNPQEILGVLVEHSDILRKSLVRSWLQKG